jgi:hypothetical protein
MDVVGQVLPAVETAVGAYGAGVLTRAEDAAANETVRLGQRALARIFRRGPAPGIERAVRDLAAAGPEDTPDAESALRLELRKLLRQDPELSIELEALLPVRNVRTVSIGGFNYGIVSTGDGAANIQL